MNGRRSVGRTVSCAEIEKSNAAAEGPRIMRMDANRGCGYTTNRTLGICRPAAVGMPARRHRAGPSVQSQASGLCSENRGLLSRPAADVSLRDDCRSHKAASPAGRSAVANDDQHPV